MFKGYDYLTENLSKLLIHILSKGSGRDLETGFRKDYLHWYYIWCLGTILLVSGSVYCIIPPLSFQSLKNWYLSYIL